MVARRAGWLLPLAVLSGCASPRESAAADACDLFEDSIEGFLAVTGPGGGWSEAAVSEAVANTPRYLEDAAQGAPGDLPDQIRAVARQVQLYGQSRHLELDTAEVSGRLAVAVRQVQSSCEQEGTTVELLNAGLG